MRPYCVIVLLLFALPRAAFGQDPVTLRPPPALREIYPAAGQRGATIRLRLTGKFLEEVGGILASHPGITANLVVPPPPKGARGRRGRREARASRALKSLDAWLAEHDLGTDAREAL